MVAAGAAGAGRAPRSCAAGGRRPRRRRSRPGRSGSPRRAGSRSPRGTGCARAPSPSRARSARSPGRPSRGGRTRRGEPRRQQPAVGEVVDGRHQLLAGQVAGDAEDHQPARAGDAGQPPVLRVAQRVGVAPSDRSSAQRRADAVEARPGRRRWSRSTGGRWSASTFASPAAWAVRTAEGERPVGDLEVGLGLAGDLQEHADRRAALVELAGRVQEPRTPAERGRPLGARRDRVARTRPRTASRCRSR